MNKKGFTVVELLTTFVLITIVVSLLVMISTSLSKMYTTSSTKTELIYKQSVISKKMNEAFLLKQIVRIDRCNDKCITLTYSDYSTTRIEIDDTLIHIGKDTYDIVKHSNIGDVRIELVYSPITHGYKYDTILNIRIPISYKGLNENYGINLVYQFNRSKVQVSI